MSSASIYRRVENSALDNGKEEEEEEGFCAGKRTCFAAVLQLCLSLFGLKVIENTDTPVDGY